MKAPRKSATISSATAPPVPLTKGGAVTPDERAAAALLSRLPRVSVSGPAVERVWRGATSPPRRGSRFPQLAPFARSAGIAATFTALFIGVLWGVFGHTGLNPSRTEGPRVELAYSAGSVFAATQAKDWHPSHPGEALTESDRLRTDDAGRALVRIHTVASVLVDQKSDLHVLRLTDGTTLRLTQGTLTARVSKRAPGEPFVVEAGRYRVRVVGTLFTVEEGPGEHTAVSVREGVVEVSKTDDGSHVDRVVAGTRWTSEAPAARSGDHTPNDVAKLLEEDLAAGNTRDLGRDFSALTKTEAALTEPPPPPPRDPLPGPLPRGDVRPAREPPNRTAPTRAVPSAAPAMSASPVPSPSAAPEPSAAPSSLPAPAGSVPTLAIANDAGVEPYARGMELEANGDIEGAARELAKAADRDPVHGDLALYSLGRLQHRRLHDPSSALATFQRYRARYPLGALLPEVDFEILQLDLETHDRTAALTETGRFLARHPGSERTSQVHLLRGNLLRDGGRCAEALPDYAAVREEPLTGDALYSTAYCERKLGDRAAAAKTLTEYLRRFPHGEHSADAARALESGREIETGGEK